MGEVLVFKGRVYEVISVFRWNRWLFFFLVMWKVWVYIGIVFFWWGWGVGEVRMKGEMKVLGIFLVKGWWFEVCFLK